VGPPALGLGQQGSILLQPHTGRRGQKQWSEAFGRGPEGKYSLSSNGMDHFTAAAVTCWWCWDGSMGRPHTSRPSQQKKKKANASSLHCPSASLPDAKRRNQEPVWKYQSSV